jgi:anti-sigma regulatory factor (Ser/Thr protein kinase)
MLGQLRFSISEASAAAEARRAATALAQTLGFDATASGRVAIVVTEAATNLARHSVQGQLLLRAVECEGVAGLETLALDQGPGMANVGECLRDGYSTAGGQGSGLGAMMRQADEFDIHSMAGKGTAVFARVWSRKPPVSNRLPRLEIGVVCLPKPGETAYGDAWAVEQRGGHCVILVADGLGHGPDAAAASMEAVKVLRTQAHLAPAALIEFAHGALRSTRGAAVAVAELDLAKEVRYAGIGNIAGVTLAPGSDRHMVSHNGIVGHEMRKVQEFVYPWSSDALLVMHSDGLATHWDLDHYPGLASRHPSLIAGVLYRDFTRGRDDVAVLVAKQQ